MIPGVYNIRIVRGDDYLETYNISQVISDVKTPVNLTGWTVEASLTELIGGASHAMTAVVTDAVNGIVQVSLPRAYTSTLQTRNANWYLALINPSDLKETYVAGDAFFITRGGPI